MTGPGINDIAERSKANFLALRQLTGDTSPEEGDPKWGPTVVDAEVKAAGLMLVIQNFCPKAKSVEPTERAKHEASTVCHDSEFETVDDLAIFINLSAVTPMTRMRAAHAVLRSKALIAKNLSASSRQADQKESVRLTEAVSNNLGQIATQDKNSIFSLIVNEPDFQWLRETEAFKSLDLEIPGID